jgi:hypothetical protein
VRVTLIIEGGLAALPGLAAPLVVNTDTLPAQLATRAETLASMVLQQSAGTAPAATPDARTYTLRIEGDGDTSTRCYADPVQDTAAQALIDLCRAHGRAQRAQPK